MRVGGSSWGFKFIIIGNKQKKQKNKNIPFERYCPELANSYAEKYSLFLWSLLECCELQVLQPDVFVQDMCKIQQTTINIFQTLISWFCMRHFHVLSMSHKHCFRIPGVILYWPWSYLYSCRVEAMGNFATTNVSKSGWLYDAALFDANLHYKIMQIHW